MLTKRNLRTGLLILTTSLALGACSQPLSNREKGALIGGGAGAAGGALLGEVAGGAPGTGALVGGAAGAVGGALVGDQKDRRRWD